MNQIKKEKFSLQKDDIVMRNTKFAKPSYGTPFTQEDSPQKDCTEISMHGVEL